MKRLIGWALLLLAAAPASLHGQFYFGQNKVQYRTFDFQVIKTEHFDVYFYERERPAAMDAARMAERSYARLSRVLNHEFRERKPIILYASHSDFQQTNALGGDSPSEATGGVTEFFRHRMVLPFTGSYAELAHVLQHEMTHQFQYDIYSRGHAGAGIQTLIQVNPPLWFFEGMAEYLSRGPVDPETAMWLRDAALTGKLPTIEQLEKDPRVFPYRFGHAIMAFIGERWGDEAIGAILQGSVAGGGIDGAVRRALGLDLRQLSDQWRDAVQKQYLPEVADRQKARAFAQEVLTERRSEGTLHLAPALSPDGSEVAFFSERDFYFVDLYLADAATGKVKRRLLKSTYSSNYETYRFINSSASWSPDGKYITVAGKRGPQDEILVLDPKRNKIVSRIVTDLNGVTTPTFSPDGKQIVFTGYDGGLSDLFIVNSDGTGLRRLTQDKYADLHPVWSPDGKTIAFATDRGPNTDFTTLAIGNLRIALYHLDQGTIEVLPEMEQGKNVSPQWSPDGRELAFVSDRNGVSNIFLYDLESRKLFQITDLFTGVQGITPFSPVLSWATLADRLAFVYYEDGKYDVYTVDNPRSLRKQSWQPTPAVAVVSPATAAKDTQASEPQAPIPASAVRDSTQSHADEGQSGSLYRTPQGFRPADDASQAPDSTQAPAPVSIAALLDSANLSLPDTAEFSVQKYKVKYHPDYIARPTIGYTRDNFGNGFFGGSAIALSDLLGDHTLLFSGYVNGRLSEADIEATYINQAHRLNWATGIGQSPYYFLLPDSIAVDSPSVGTNTLITNVRRFVVRSAFVEAYYPFSRFKRVEMGLRLANVNDAVQSILEPYDPLTGQLTANPTFVQFNRSNINYVQPSLGYTFDNSLMGYVGPFYGRRYRLELSQTIGSWKITNLLADYRRYDHLLGPFTLATRALYYGGLGADADSFQVFLGHTDLVRGNTSGSYRRNECRAATVQTGCPEFDRLIGTELAVASAELRFPLLNASLGFLPIGFPPFEGAVFYDVGVAWDQHSKVKLSRDPLDDPIAVRTPLQTIGLSIRGNLFGIAVLRFDYSWPQNRPGVKGYWTVSLGPTY